MTTKTEGVYTAEFIVSEANGKRSRDVVTLVSGQNRKAGDVLGKITASGKYAIYNNGASDGTEAAAAILYADVDATGGDKPAVVINVDAEVKAALLGWNGQDSTAKNAGLADLLAKNIKAR